MRLALLLFAAAIPSAATAQVIVVSGSPGSLQITGATAGSAPTPASDGTTTYNAVAVPLTKRITGRLNTPLPAGVSIFVTLAAPAGGTSMGAVSLTTTDQNLVTGIPFGAYTNLSITYQLRATSAAGVVPLSSRTVTFSLAP